MQFENHFIFSQLFTSKILSSGFLIRLWCDNNKITELTADTRTTKLNLEKSSCCANKKKKGFFKRFLDWF